MPDGPLFIRYELTAAACALTLGLGCSGVAESADDDPPMRPGPKTSVPAMNGGATMPGATMPGATMPAPNPEATTPVGPATCGGKSPQVGPAPMRRLTPAEYASTIRDLVGQTTKVSASSRAAAGFDNDIANLTVSSLIVEQQLTDAETIAKAATADPSKLLSCDPKTADAACIRRFLETFGQRAYRRPLESADVDSLYGTYELGKSNGDIKLGLEYAVEHMLLSPAFVYRVELGEPAPAGQARKLTSWEMASRLSYFLWGTMPDQALQTAATENKLRSRDEIGAQVRRMMRDTSGQPVPAMRETAASFHAQWLQLRNVDTVAKDAATFPTFATLKKLMRQETDRFIDELVWNKGTVSDLLGARYSYINEALAGHYKVAGVTGPDLRKVNLDPMQRAGVLTQASVMSVTAGDKGASPIKRGLFVREKFLCTDVPPPPPGVIQTLPATSAAIKTERDRYTAHSADPSCAVCHRLFDQVGFAFDYYDAVGGYRAQNSKGIAIDGRGELVLTDVDGAFANAIELTDRLAKSPGVQSCVAEHWYQYMQGRPDGAEDSRALQSLTKQLGATGGRMEDLIIALTQSDAFSYLPGIK